VKSIFLKILVWLGFLLALTFVAFGVINAVMMRGAVPPMRFARVAQMQLDEARTAYEGRGPAAAAAVLDRMNRYFEDQHYLLDGKGRDVISGEDRSEQVKQIRSRPRRGPGLFPFFAFRPPPRNFQVAHSSEDGNFTLLIVGYDRNLVNAPNPLYYFACILLMIVLLCYVLAFHFVSPLRTLRETVLRFGAGDLSARAGSKRRDEFGDLARTFDTMADRMETLLTAERRLLQDVSHELRSPLARLQFAVELARTSSDRQASLDRIKKEVLQLTNLVGELIQMTQAEGDPAERRFAPVPLSPLIESVVENCRTEAESKGCRFDLDIWQPCKVSGDENLLRRAMENVVRNAVRYAPDNSKIDISLARDNGSVHLAVRDYGPGVPDDALENLFRPFFRVEDDRARNSGGVGLGLSIARRALLLHNGAIQAQNSQPGLKVDIELPADVAD
jgi:signal transduction histidine kinase